MLKQKLWLKAEHILEYFVTDNDTLILCPQPDIALTTTDHALYEALGSIQDCDNFNWRKLVKFLEVVKVISYENVNHQPKPILSQEKVEFIRKLVLEEENGTKNQS